MRLSEVTGVHSRAEKRRVTHNIGAAGLTTTNPEAQILPVSAPMRTILRGWYESLTTQD